MSPLYIVRRLDDPCTGENHSPCHFVTEILSMHQTPHPDLSYIPYLSPLLVLARDCLERVERIACGRDDHSRDLWVPVELLDVLLSLVDEQELRRDLQWFAIGIERGGRCLIFIELDGQVPKGELVV